MMADRWTAGMAAGNERVASTALHDLKKMDSLGPKGAEGLLRVSLFGNSGSTESN